MSKPVIIALQVILAVICLFLAYQVYEAIQGPQREIEKDKALTQLTRNRMDFFRQALIKHERSNHYYMTSLDSVVIFAKGDNELMEWVKKRLGESTNLDSLKFSPRNGEAFTYTVNDSGTVRVYKIEDPASDEFIGTTDPDDLGARNVASWE